MNTIPCKQYDDTWWRVRRGVPTASEFSNIITPKTAEYAKAAQTYIYQLIADLYDPYYGPRNNFQTAAMQNGSVMEPAARRFYEFERDIEVVQVGFVLSDDGKIGCSPDGLPGDGVLELKVPTTATHVKYLLAGVMPPEYLPQCHGHLVVTGRPWCDFMSFSEGLPPLLVRVEANDFTDKLREHLALFLADYEDAKSKVEASFPPPPPPPEPVIVTAAGFEPVQSTFQDSYF